MELNFMSLRRAYAWKKIRGSADRLVFKKENGDMTLPEILGKKAKILRFDNTPAKDLVYVAKIKDGGMISFLRRDGTYIHTLNPVEQFEGKLAELNIDLELIKK